MQPEANTDEPRIRVAEEAIEEAISKAEAYGDSLVCPPPPTVSVWKVVWVGSWLPRESAACGDAIIMGLSF